ncbi:MAG: hypothetical protein RLZZ59_385 [Pseudomonadota bacterium]|jgi:MHS family proline/betaine transporter-like MFS transporter
MNIKKLIFSSGVANSFEWYDYALFAHFAGIIGDKFFPSEDHNASLLNAFFVFAMGYLMRPVGGVIFGTIGDKFGRRIALSASVMCMGLPTAIIGLLPTYEDIGITASILMVIARMLQGLSMGGALTGAISFSIEHAPKERRGITGSISMAGICIGVLVGAIVASITENCLSKENFHSWGWRIPFILGIAIVLAGYYIKKHTTETPMFNTARTHHTILKSPLKEVMRNHWKDMLISIVINSTGSLLFYLQAVFLKNYLSSERNIDHSTLNYMINSSYVIMAIFTIFSGWLSDIIGRVRIYAILNIIIMLSSFMIMEIFDIGNVEGIWIAQIILSILAASYIGAEPALQAEFYPTNVRNTALSISYNLAVSIFGGTTPYILLTLLNKTHTIVSTAYYMIGCAFFSTIALFFYKNRS